MQTNAADPMLIPVVRERQSPTMPLSIAGWIDGRLQLSSSEMKRTGCPLGQEGRDIAAMEPA